MKKLWKVQEKAVRYAMEHPYTMLNMEMGTGKTRVAIETIRRTRPGRVLVVAPKSVVPVWKREIDKYTEPGEFEVLELGSGTINSRSRRLVEFLQNTEPERAVVVINYDVVWRDTILRHLIRPEWGVVVLDESHRAKSHKSKTSRACYRLGKQAQRRLCLSGTPMSNSPLDVFGQYRFLDDRIFGRYWTPFVDQYGIRGGPERRFIVGFRNLEDLGRRFNSIAFTCTKDDIRDEASLVDIDSTEYRFGSLSPEAARVYRGVQRDFVAELGSEWVTADNVLVQMLRLQQLTSGFTESVDEAGKSTGYRRLDTVKGAMLKDLLQDIPKREPVVVFYKFRKDAEGIREIMGDGDRPIFELSGERNEIVAWESSENGLLMAQYQAGSVGIDLTHANYLVFFSLTFSLAEYTQARARVHRPGQKRPVTLVHLLLEGTIDEVIREALDNKQDVIRRVIEHGWQPGY